MSPLFYQILHVLSVILLVGFVISACTDPRPERKKGVMILTGVLSLLVLVGGFGLAMKIHGISNPVNFTGWMLAKIVVLILLSGVAGMVFRRASAAKIFLLVTVALTATAVYLVYARPLIFGH